MKRSNRVGSRLFIGLGVLFLYLPIFLLIIFSFNAGDSSAVWKGFSLDWYASLFQNRLIMESLYTTLLVSLLAPVISTAAGTFAAIGLYSLGRKKRDALLARMGLTGVPLRELERHAPVDLLMETKRVAETLRREYGLFQTASQVARNTLECNLRMIEKARAQLEGEAPPPGENGDQPSQYELRV